MDEKVESDILKRYDIACDDAKRLRSHYVNLSKRYTSRADQYEFYLNVYHSFIHQ